jgi:CHAD domain-containing protein
MQTTKGNLDEAMHDARVCFKKIRAVVWLVWAELDGDIFRQEQAYYRDAGRRLSAVRDTAAMIEAFDKLTDRFATQLAADALSERPLPFLSDAGQLQRCCLLERIVVVGAPSIQTSRTRR